MDMDQDKFARFIKDIRKKNNLTQKQFADKYNVTYQAVSKWENGINMPDTALMKKISEDYGISIDELLNGEYKKTNKKKFYMILIMSIFAIVFVIFMVLMIVKTLDNKNDDFHFKTLSTECENFTISGNISYNENKSAIYITNIKYCGGEDNEEYKEIECILYESDKMIERKISSFKSKHEKIKLEDFLQDVTLTIDNYEKTCKEYQEDSLYLTINATSFNGKTTTYKIPLKLSSCSK